MLVLARKLSQSITIGDDIRIMVVHLGDGQVKLGIDAPPHIPVHREEVAEQIRRQRGGR